MKKFLPLLIVVVVGGGAILFALRISGVTLDPDRAQIESLLKKNDCSIEAMSPLVKKTIDGHPYSLALVKVKGKNAFGMPITNTLGYVSDIDAGYYYTLNEETFNHFLQTGDKSGFPKVDKPLAVGDVPAADHTPESTPTPKNKQVIYPLARQAYYDAQDYFNEHPGVDPNSIDVYNYGHHRATEIGFTGADESKYVFSFHEALNRIKASQ